MFSESTRLLIRRELQLEDCFVIGHIGRFDYQKNHRFILQYFTKFSKINNKARLVLIGDGHLKNGITDYSKSLDIHDKVLFLESRQDANLYYNIFDLFILPSLFEGLGMVLVEAQANGLNCIASSNVPLSSNILGNVKYLSLKESEKWLEKTNQIFSDCRRHKIDKEVFASTGYSLKDECNRIQKNYINIMNNIAKVNNKENKI